MLWYCAFTWHHNTTRSQVAQRVVQQHDAGMHRPDQIRGWYNLAGGGAGFLLIETNSLEELNGWLQPYMDLVSWDVRAVNQLDYENEIERMRQVAQQTT